MFYSKKKKRQTFLCKQDRLVSIRLDPSRRNNWETWITKNKERNLFEGIQELPRQQGHEQTRFQSKCVREGGDSYAALRSPGSMGRIVSGCREFSAISWDKIGVYSLLRRRRSTENRPAFSWELSRARGQKAKQVQTSSSKNPKQLQLRLE